MNNQQIYINKYLPFAILYFFFNGVLLPIGLLYTTLLTPLLIVWLIRYPVIKYLPLFFYITIPFALFHFINGVDIAYYLRSYMLLLSVYVFGLAFYQYLENCFSLQNIYKKIILLNAVFVIIALIALRIPALDPVFWNDNRMSLGNINFRRLKLLTYEPSYYSILFAPIAIFYLIKIARREIPQPVLYFLLTVIPLVLSLSFGVILGIILTFGILILINFRDVVLNKANFKYILMGVGIAGAFLLVLFIFFPNNIFFLRIANTLSGRDLSFNGRTFDSFVLGSKIAEQKSLLWGTGPGQVKLIGLDFFKEFYNNYRFTIADIGIPNNVADILATFGLAGVIIKLFLEIYFYFSTRVYNNYYRQALFLFIFIYQFTGSYIMNIAEYAIWIIAFKQNIFTEFDKPASILKNKLRRH